jgi:hypothetical protein
MPAADLSLLLLTSWTRLEQQGMPATAAVAVGLQTPLHGSMPEKYQELCPQGEHRNSLSWRLLAEAVPPATASAVDAD